jgi:hypothetical protein
MICPNCQKEIADGSKFCYNCGARLAADAPPPPPAYSAAPPKRLMRSSRDKKLGGVCAGDCSRRLVAGCVSRRHRYSGLPGFVDCAAAGAAGRSGYGTDDHGEHLM